ncbi:MAG: flagellar filament capping protein FliD, partial [Azonexus sp.]|nr:flagellar filament capping protein FliD [Azonexus sp.]
LFDPESAFRMMSEINQREVNYKAEFAEMNDMGAYVETMRTAAATLEGIDGESSNAAIRNGLQDFVTAYNGWIDRFDEVLADGGLLAGTQAAKVAQWELEKSVDSVFHGAAGGVRGMTALGISIDPVSNMASLDTAKLDSVLAANQNGAIAAIREFSSNFARSAELLNTAGNFIPNRMNNLSRVIDYIDGNKSALQAEFGLGNTARPSGDVARALAAYNAMRGTST